MPVAPVNATDMILLPQGLTALKQVAKEVGVDRRGAYLNLDGGCDSPRNRQRIFHAGLIPTITENTRNRKHPTRGRKRLFNAAIHALRRRVERTFAWEDTCKRLLRRFAHIQQRHDGMKWMAYTLINLRAFCGTSNLQPVRLYVRWRMVLFGDPLYSPWRGKNLASVEPITRQPAPGKTQPNSP